MLTEKLISLVVINYKDEGSIKALYERATETLKKVTPNYEIVYVNDGSPDKSEEILRELSSLDNKLSVVLHSRNFGRENAFTSGIKQAIGEAVIVMDGDLQDPPELIPDLVKKWLEGFEVVYGVREKREKSLKLRHRFFYHFFYIIFSKMTSFPVPKDTGDFSLMDRKVVNALNSLPEKDRFTRGLRAWVGFKQIGLKFNRAERYWGNSTLQTFSSGFSLAKKAIFSFSYKPLEWLFGAAMFSVIVFLVGIVYYLSLYFIHPGGPKGFSTLIVVVLFVGSIQLVAISILSEYIRRIFEEVKSRPVSIIKEIINDHRLEK